MTQGGTRLRRAQSGEVAAVRGRFSDSYAVAVATRHLAAGPADRTTNADVLGAAGLAGRRSPLAMSLLRLFVGDVKEAPRTVDILARMVQGKAAQPGGVALTHTDAADIARAVLAWHRFGQCPACTGHGFELAGVQGGRRAFSGRPCMPCGGTGKIPFESQFPRPWVPLARWLQAEVEREQTIAGHEAMKKLGPRMGP